MRNDKKSLSRLKRLANYLKKGEFSQDYDSVKVYCFTYGSIICFKSNFYVFAPIVLEEMPKIFPIEWGRNWNDKVIYFRYPNTNTHYAIAHYFGLTVEEAQHCFQADSQFPEIYGGIHLTEKTFNPKSIVRNINGLIRNTKRMDLYDRKLIHREVLIEKSTRISPSFWLKSQQ